MQSVGPDQADLFLFNLRCIATRQIEVLACSGRYGIYVEPRSGPHDELLRIQQCKPQMVGLARLGTRWGLRSKVEDAAALAKQHKPGSVFLGAGPRMSFEIGPFPYEMDRLTVSKLCSQWNWQARPLHPCRSVDGLLGNIGLVHACVQPPNSAVRSHNPLVYHLHPQLSHITHCFTIYIPN
jgi:hypothetical protein